MDTPATAPLWQQANPAVIARALAFSQTLAGGDWYVLDATRRLRRPLRMHGVRRGPVRTFEINGVELVAWHSEAGDGAAADARPSARSDIRTSLLVGPATCPHMGADLARATVNPGGCLVCPWHGLALGRTAHGAWQPWRVHDDGVLTWVQPPGFGHDTSTTGTAATGRAATGRPMDAPILSARPVNGIDAVIRRVAVCEPIDVIANRLDPWHGPHFHPYAFSRLEVTEHDDAQLTMRVAYRVIPKRYDMEVTARFHCPDPRTITMTIIDGEATGSVVETHATPIRSYVPARQQLPRTAIIEATIATSDRPGFEQAKRGAAMARPLIRMMAARLWRDDARYAERLFTLRHRDT